MAGVAGGRSPSRNLICLYWCCGCTIYNLTKGIWRLERVYIRLLPTINHYEPHPSKLEICRYIHVHTHIDVCMYVWLKITSNYIFRNGNSFIHSLSFNGNIWKVCGGNIIPREVPRHSIGQREAQPMKSHRAVRGRASPANRMAASEFTRSHSAERLRRLMYIAAPRTLV